MSAHLPLFTFCLSVFVFISVSLAIACLLYIDRDETQNGAAKTTQTKTLWTPEKSKYITWNYNKTKQKIYFHADDWTDLNKKCIHFQRLCGFLEMRNSVGFWCCNTHKNLLLLVGCVIRKTKNLYQSYCDWIWQASAFNFQKENKPVDIIWICAYRKNQKLYGSTQSINMNWKVCIDCPKIQNKTKTKNAY